MKNFHNNVISVLLDDFVEKLRLLSKIYTNSIEWDNTLSPALFFSYSFGCFMMTIS